MQHDSDAIWEKLGRNDPYFGVWTEERFRAAGKEGTAREEFFASGQNYVEELFSILRDHFGSGFAPKRALDFGCGVGRVAIPMARRVPVVVGVDVSTAMLEEARRNCDLPRWRAWARWLRKSVPLVHNLANVGRGRPFGDPPIRMNSYNLNRLLRILQQNGCHRVSLRFTEHAGHLGVILLIQRQTLAHL